MIENIKESAILFGKITGTLAAFVGAIWAAYHFTDHSWIYRCRDIQSDGMRYECDAHINDWAPSASEQLARELATIPGIEVVRK